jgi:hypothetical protein
MSVVFHQTSLPHPGISAGLQSNPHRSMATDRPERYAVCIKYFLEPRRILVEAGVMPCELKGGTHEKHQFG